MPEMPERIWITNANVVKHAYCGFLTKTEKIENTEYLRSTPEREKAGEMRKMLERLYHRLYHTGSRVDDVGDLLASIAKGEDNASD